MQDINGYERFIGLLPGCYSMGVSHPETFVAGANLVLNSAEAPLTALTVYGHSTQDGTPSPDNPVPIVSAGDSGAINVTVQGGNLVDLNVSNVSTIMPGNSTYSYDGYTATLTTILTEEDLTDLAPANNRIYRNFFIQLGDDFAGKTVTISYDSAEIMFDMEQIIGLVYTDDSGTPIYNHLASNIESKSLTIAIPDTATNIRFRIMLIETNSPIKKLTPGTYTAKINGIMLALGASKLPWMPYKLPQTLTLQTPNGLPGIPVDSGGNYTDADGQQWVCDEIDFKRGKYVQRVKKFVVTSDTRIMSLNPYATAVLDVVQPFRATEYNGQIIKLSAMMAKNFVVRYAWNIAEEVAYTVEQTIDFNILNERIGTNAESTSGEAVAAVREWLKDNPLTFLCQLITPIETDLPAEEIAAYKALHTYSPNTTVSNDAEAWMKVGYYSNAALEKMSREALKINGGNLK